mmetsp:Transcript_2325/g.6539  ORF Transcript_2325/g.6539 Transcript_2325/m.6539 type:complete len:163 (-) Transcript_2325:85-573(-)
MAPKHTAMAPKHRLTLKGPAQEKRKPPTSTALVIAKANRPEATRPDANSPENTHPKMPPYPPNPAARAAPAGEGGGVLVAQHSGRGLKAVQHTKEMETKRSNTDGTNIESKSKVKAQKLYHSKSNEHVETKIHHEEQKRKTCGKTGTVTVTQVTTMRKVSYL